MTSARIKYLLSNKWLSFNDICLVFKYLQFTNSYKDTITILNNCYHEKDFKIYFNPVLFDINNHQSNIYLSYGNRVINKKSNLDIFKGFFSDDYNDCYLEYDRFVLYYLDIDNPYLEVASSYALEQQDDNRAVFCISGFVYRNLYIRLKKKVFENGNIIFKSLKAIKSDVNEQLEIYVKTYEFIKVFKDILNLEPYITTIHNPPKTNIEEQPIKEAQEVEPYLDSEHPYYSTDLALCVELWKDLYINNFGNQSQGVKNRVKQWLKDKKGLELEDNSQRLKKITSIINYDNNPYKTKKS
ncbi:hypothetical protein [Francisella philomiragia]|uniref:Uncharacterized protein n=1 Tax=Francisella philomiragia TaxID=28110 RepID=A0ABS1GDG1_9GAMM|nr:hypothetical protein [Francisella philomiragia]MBK2259178.1 hypothetical protein [Francisella philomiragia]MBK2302785.1 hypothetical protein [Francisella philomiragia]